MSTNSTSANSRSWTPRLPGFQNVNSVLGEPLASFWIPLLLGLILAAVASMLISGQEWVFLFALAILIPAILLFLIYPFSAILVWLILFPFFLQEILPGARIIYWLLHRAMIPSALTISLLATILKLRAPRPVRFSIIDLAILGYLVLSIINIVYLTDQPVDQLIRFYDRLFIPICMFWLVRVIHPRETELKWLVPAAFIVIFSQSVIGILSWFAPDLLPEVWLSRIGDRTVGTFNNPAVYSTTLIFCALILVQTALFNRIIWVRWIALAGIAAAVFFVFFTFSRGSWLGALVVIVGLSTLYPKFVLKLFLAGSVAFTLLLLASPLAEFTEFARERLMTQDTAESRIVSGAASIRMIQTRPLQGWGYGEHELYDEQFRTRVFDLPARGENSSHNTYLLLAAEMGLPGLLLYLFPAVWLLVLSFRYRRRLPRIGLLGSSIMVMLWLLLADHFIAGNFTDLIRSNFFSTVIWWLCLGWIANILDYAQSKSRHI